MRRSPPTIAPGTAPHRPHRDDPAADMTTAPASPISPAPAMLSAMFAAPLAWVVQTLAADALGGFHCYAADPSPATPLAAWTQPALMGLSMLCVAIGVAGLARGWREIRRTGKLAWAPLRGARRSRAERDWFVARVAALVSAMFVAGLIASMIDMLFVRPCGGW